MGTMKEIERLVAEQAESGESVAAFCAARGFKVKSFYVWRQRVRERRERMVPVVITYPSVVAHGDAHVAELLPPPRGKAEESMSKGKEWERVIEGQRGSGQSISQYCRERGISDKSFGYWSKRLREPSRGNPADGRRAFAAVGASATIEFISPSGVRAHIPVGMSVKELRVIVEALGASDS